MEKFSALYDAQLDVFRSTITDVVGNLKRITIEEFRRVLEIEPKAEPILEHILEACKTYQNIYPVHPALALAILTGKQYNVAPTGGTLSKFVNFSI